MACKRCGRCCQHFPCAVFPSDAKRMAKYFNTTIEKLFGDVLVWFKRWDGNIQAMPMLEGIGSDTFHVDSSYFWKLVELNFMRCKFLLYDGKKYSCAMHGFKPRGAKEMSCGEDRVRHKVMAENRCAAAWKKYARGHLWVYGQWQ